jgi:hypothetical protein
MIDEKIKLELINSNKIINFPKKPVRGGIPAIENKITINENDQRLFN